MRSTKPIAFKWRHFQGELILQSAALQKIKKGLKPEFRA